MIATYISHRLFIYLEKLTRFFVNMLGIGDAITGGDLYGVNAFPFML